MELNEKPIPFDEVTNALLDIDHPFPPRYIHRFSDLSREEIKALQEIWGNITTDRRSALFDDLETINDTEFLVNFEEISKMALIDTDERVRVRALSILFESEDTHIIPTLITMLHKDPEETVRAQAASTLGKFIYLGEMEEIPSEKAHLAEEALLLAHSRIGERTLVRRRALEGLGFSDTRQVRNLIQKAYESGEPDWRASALFAMGRSADEHWGNIVLNEIHNSDPTIQFEALTAAGELHLKAALESILELFEEEIDQGEVRDSAIWALARIGGSGVRELLEKLAEEADENGEEDDLNYITSALDELDFTEEIGLATLLELEEGEIEPVDFTDLDDSDPNHDD